MREALEKILQDTKNDLYVPPEALFAPIIERALRAAWEKGWADRKMHRHLVPNTDRGVTAFVAAMVEE